jgi:hypothetical protein
MTTNRVTCPDCGAVLRVELDASDNEPIVCPKCDTSFVPAADPEVAGARPRSDSKAAVTVVSIILGVVLLVGGAVAAVLLLVVRPALKEEPIIKAAAVDETNLPPKQGMPPPPFVPPVRQAAKPGEPGVDVGNLALEIDAEDIDGKKFKLSDYRGKVVLLDFWGNW